MLKQQKSENNVKEPIWPAQSRYRRAKAFTLIELLVVIAIIAILAALLPPPLRNAKNHAQAVVDLNNNRQLLTATIIYTGDNNDRMPESGWGGGVTCWAYLAPVPVFPSETVQQYNASVLPQQIEAFMGGQLALALYC